MYLLVGKRGSACIRAGKTYGVQKCVHAKDAISGHAKVLKWAQLNIHKHIIISFYIIL